MSALEEYEKKFHLPPLDADDLTLQADNAEGRLRNELLSGRNFSDLPTYNRTIIFQRNRIRALEAELADTRERAGKLGDELTKMFGKVADLEATNEDLRGRKLGSSDAWAEAASESLGMYDHMRGLHEAMKATIRALLGTELPSGELRQALGELVK